MLSIEYFSIITNTVILLADTCNPDIHGKREEFSNPKKKGPTTGGPVKLL